MSGEEQGSNPRPVLVPEEYDSVSSDEENRSVPEQEQEDNDPEHGSVLSYETISETPLESSRGSVSPDPVGEGPGSQEIFPTEQQNDEPLEQAETLAPLEDHDGAEREGKFSAFFS